MDAEFAVNLMQSVINQALIDAVTPLPSRWRRHAEETATAFVKRKARDVLNARRVRDDARDWLSIDDGDFRFIASHAGYDADDLRERALKLRSQGWPRHTTPRGAAAHAA